MPSAGKLSIVYVAGAKSLRVDQRVPAAGERAASSSSPSPGTRTRAPSSKSRALASIVDGEAAVCVDRSRTRAASLHATVGERQIDPVERPVTDRLRSDLGCTLDRLDLGRPRPRPPEQDPATTAVAIATAAPATAATCIPWVKASRAASSRVARRARRGVARTASTAPPSVSSAVSVAPWRDAAGTASANSFR